MKKKIVFSHYGGQKMALNAPNLISPQPVDIYEIKRSQRHLLTTIENKRLGVPISVNIQAIILIIQLGPVRSSIQDAYKFFIQ